VYFTVEGASATNSIVFDGHLVTPVTLQFWASPNLPPGTYQWNVVVHWAKGDLVIPVTAASPPTPTVFPQSSVLVNAASAAPAYTFAPGEIMSLYGQNLSTSKAGVTLDKDGKVATQLLGVTVSVGGIASPLLYVSPTQVDFVAPYEIAGGDTATVEVTTPAGVIILRPFPIAPSDPGIFTVASNSFPKAAAALNQDNSPNSLINPAPRGSVIQIFGTGEGQTSPAGVTGSVTADVPKTPVLPVSVTIGGVDAPVMFAGSAPRSIAGLFQVNAVVPDGAPIGARVPIVLNVGGVRSQNGVFIAVR
jgi:uncharacterized protein (TIGR03437 family)